MKSEGDGGELQCEARWRYNDTTFKHLGKIRINYETNGHTVHSEQVRIKCYKYKCHSHISSPAFQLCLLIDKVSWLPRFHRLFHAHFHVGVGVPCRSSCLHTACCLTVLFSEEVASFATGWVTNEVCDFVKFTGASKWLLLLSCLTFLSWVARVDVGRSVRDGDALETGTTIICELDAFEMKDHCTHPLVFFVYICISYAIPTRPILSHFMHLQTVRVEGISLEI